ncbi:MAG TPA: hypothetical protein VG478_01175 [Acidimicrobiales bacterium]|nr:hypothetical protein [Acidimicrobiales bacterium]
MSAMALTMWINDFTGKRLSVAELREHRRRAHEAYRVNAHIFEDETEALAALGIVPMLAV